MATTISSLRLLIVSPLSRPPYSPSPLRSVLYALTGIPPTQDQVSSGFAGYTQHPPLQLRTKYYHADVGIWCDEIPLSVPSSEAHDPPNTKIVHVTDGASGVTPTLGQPTELDVHHHGLQSLGEGRAASPAEIALTNNEVQVEASPSLSTWLNTMLSEPAQEVREAIGGIVLALPLTISLLPTSSASSSRYENWDEYLEILEAVDELRQMIEDENLGKETPAVVLVTGTGRGIGKSDLDATIEKLEGVMREDKGLLGWEVVGWDGVVAEDDGAESRSGGSRNAFGERVGIDRVKELLEAVDWSGPGNGQEGRDLNLDFLSSDDEDRASGVDGIKYQGQELEREMMGLKLAMREQYPDDEDAVERHSTSQDMDEDKDLQIDQFPRLLERVVAIREAGADMSTADRQKFARREVERIMQDLT